MDGDTARRCDAGAYVDYAQRPRREGSERGALRRVTRSRRRAYERGGHRHRTVRAAAGAEFAADTTRRRQLRSVHSFQGGAWHNPALAADGVQQLELLCDTPFACSIVCAHSSAVLGAVSTDHCNIDETEVLALADAFETLGLKAAGYE